MLATAVPRAAAGSVRVCVGRGRVSESGVASRGVVESAVAEVTKAMAAAHEDDFHIGPHFKVVMVSWPIPVSWTSRLQWRLARPCATPPWATPPAVKEERRPIRALCVSKTNEAHRPAI